MELPLLTKVLPHVHVAASRPAIMAALILVIRASNFEIMDKVKDKLITTKLSGFPGDNVELYCDHQLGLLQRLTNSGFLQHQNLYYLIGPLTWCTSPEFKVWALNQNKVVYEFCFKKQYMALSLIPEADCLDFEEIIRSSQFDYKQLVDANNWTPGPGSATSAAKPTLPTGYQAALPTEPLEFHTMMCQSISTAVAAAISASNQSTPPPPVGRGDRGGMGGGGRGSRGGRGGDPKQVELPSNCNRCGKSVHYVRDFPEKNTSWDPPSAGTKDTSTKVHRKKGDNSDVTMSYCSMCKRWDHHHAPGHDDCKATQVGASGTVVHASAAVATVGSREDSDDYFVPFFG